MAPARPPIRPEAIIMLRKLGGHVDSDGAAETRVQADHPRSQPLYA